MKYDYQFELCLDRVWQFQGGGILHFYRKSNSQININYKKLSWFSVHRSFFGEEVGINAGSPEHFLLDPQGWADYYKRNGQPTKEEFEEIEAEVLKIVRTELLAEYLIDRQKIDECYDLFKKNKLVRNHIYAIEPSDELRSKIENARFIFEARPGRIAADVAMDEINRSMEQASSEIPTQDGCPGTELAPVEQLQ